MKLGLRQERVTALAVCSVGTPKCHLDTIAATSREDLAEKLWAFRLWYNHVRPHQHLYGLTPTEEWRGLSKTHGSPTWFEAWDARLAGWYFERH